MASIQNQPMGNLTENDLFVFTHIPKTAGTTFKRLLERQFRPSQMPKIGPDYQAGVDQVSCACGRCDVYSRGPGRTSLFQNSIKKLPTWRTLARIITQTSKQTVSLGR